MNDIPIEKKPLFSRNIMIVILILFIFAIFAGCFWFSQSGYSKEVGRYQFYVKDNEVDAYVYILDTKTSRLFLRGTYDGEVRQLLRHSSRNEDILWDFGTINQPLHPQNTYIFSQLGTPIDKKSLEDIIQQKLDVNIFKYSLNKFIHYRWIKYLLWGMGEK